MDDLLTISRIQSFFQKVNKTDECWEWTAHTLPNGYGTFSLLSRPYLVHRIAYFLYKGELTDGLQIDHLCRNRRCVNPEHLEEVTPRVNTLRGISPSALNYGKPSCKNGHRFSKENTYIRRDRNKGRECKTCRYLSVKKFQLKGD
jgi:hypothetical protein